MKISDGPVVFVQVNEQYVPINNQDEMILNVTEIFLKDNQVYVKAESSLDDYDAVVLSQKDFLGQYRSI